MANIISPTPIGNDCVGQNADGSANIQFKCLKYYDVDGTPIYACAPMKYFLVSCSAPLNSLCNPNSGAYLPAITVCGQQLF